MKTHLGTDQPRTFAINGNTLQICETVASQGRSNLGQQWLEVERAMGIEHTAGARNPLEVMELQTREAVRAIIV